MMKPSLIKKLELLKERAAEVAHLLAQENATADIEKYTSLAREHSKLTPVVENFDLYNKTLADLDVANELQKDPEMRDFAQEEISTAQEALENIEQELQVLLLPKDPNDERNLYLEIRAGTGGDESALFSADLLRMYIRFAERNRWQTELISQSESEVGGYKEVIVRIIGKGAYSYLKFESGVHRVQRVPDTETQGRIHTSTCTVAVLPEVDDVAEVDINPAEIRVDTYRASGAGGQHINKTDSAVRITHLPTGTVVECQDDRSQHKNRAQAMKVLAARIRDQQISAQQQEQSASRKLMVGSGERSERIRTYNFPQGRVTDHRINLTLYKIESIMDGDVFMLSEALRAEHQAEQLASLSDI